MPYVQNTDQDREDMLQTIGASSLEDLFEPIPEEFLLKGPLDIEGGLSEQELQDWAAERGSMNWPAGSRANFLGGGTWDHTTPALVDQLSGRTEFLTAYTPYQPECSQGTLQWIYEFQSMIAEIAGMEVANASMYDGASSCAEAALMALNITRRKRVVVSQGLHPDARATLHTYLRHQDIEVVEAPLRNGVTDWNGLVDGETAAVFIQQPNFVGCVEPLDPVSAMCQETGALSVASIYPVAMGLLRSPGDAGFDVVVGDGQCFGVPMGYGGPHFGFFATREKYVRRMPGRLVGTTVDRQGKHAYTLTFQTREQHIRREKATSNICTNNALMALRGCIHMAALGPQGLEELASVSRQKALFLADSIENIDGVELAFQDRAFFNEIAFRVLDGSEKLADLLDAFDQAGIAAGIRLGRWYEEHEDVFTLTCTEVTREEDIECLIEVMQETLATEVVR